MVHVFIDDFLWMNENIDVKKKRIHIWKINYQLPIERRFDY